VTLPLAVDVPQRQIGVKPTRMLRFPRVETGDLRSPPTAQQNG
jgi:hypothetical protein